MATLSSKVTPSGVATEAQGTLANSAVQPNDSPTFNAVTATSYAGDGSNLTGVLRKGPDIGGSADLNTYITDGYYHQNTNANASSGTNYPAALAGMLTVTSDGLMVYQKYQTYNGNGTYQRTKYNTTWYGWDKILDSGNLTTTGTLTATAFAGDGSALTGISSGFTRFSLFTASGTFNAPADAGAAVVLYTGGGGGGAKDATFGGPGNGGDAGIGIKFIDLTPSSANAIVIGAGGNGVSANYAYGTSGGSTTCFGLTATGGAGGTYGVDGADGTAASVFPTDRYNLGTAYNAVDASNPDDKDLITTLQAQSPANTTTVAAVVYVEANDLQAGRGGVKGQRRTTNDGTVTENTNSTGGVGGFVAIWY